LPHIRRNCFCRRDHETGASQCQNKPGADFHYGFYTMNSKREKRRFREVFALEGSRFIGCYLPYACSRRLPGTFQRDALTQDDRSIRLIDIVVRAVSFGNNLFSRGRRLLVTHVVIRAVENDFADLVDIDVVVRALNLQLFGHAGKYH
jgi:hypothetical protein